MQFHGIYVIVALNSVSQRKWLGHVLHHEVLLRDIIGGRGRKRMCVALSFQHLQVLMGPKSESTVCSPQIFHSPLHSAYCISISKTSYYHAFVVCLLQYEYRCIPQVIRNNRVNK